MRGHVQWGAVGPDEPGGADRLAQATLDTGRAGSAADEQEVHHAPVALARTESRTASMPAMVSVSGGRAVAATTNGRPWPSTVFVHFSAQSRRAAAARRAVTSSRWRAVTASAKPRPACLGRVIDRAVASSPVVPGRVRRMPPVPLTSLGVCSSRRPYLCSRRPAFGSRSGLPNAVWRASTPYGSRRDTCTGRHSARQHCLRPSSTTIHDHAKEVYEWRGMLARGCPYRRDRPDARDRDGASVHRLRRPTVPVVAARLVAPVVSHGHGRRRPGLSGVQRFPGTGLHRSGGAGPAGGPPVPRRSPRGWTGSPIADDGSWRRRSSND